MESKFWNRLTRAEVVISLGGTAGFGIVLKAGADWIASNVGWIADQGWAAITLGSVASGVAIIAVSLSALRDQRLALAQGRKKRA